MHDIAYYRPHSCICNNAVGSAIKPMSNCRLVNFQLMSSVPVCNICFSVPLRTYGAGVFHASGKDFSGVDTVICIPKIRKLRKLHYLHVRKRYKKIVIIHAAVFSQVYAIISF